MIAQKDYQNILFFGKILLIQPSAMLLVQLLPGWGKLNIGVDAGLP